MGSGKSTWGRRLGKILKMPFQDTDQIIEEKLGKSVLEIFKIYGESFFRSKELECLNELGNIPSIIATGGGLPCQNGTMELMNSVGITVYLNLPHKALFNRLLQERAKRPLITDLTENELANFIEQKLLEREPYYLQAKVIVNVLKADVNSLGEHLRLR
jgi:shikimate kinase